MAKQTDVQDLVKRLMAGASLEENKALVDALMSAQVSSILDKLQRDEAPTLRPVPSQVRGFRVRLDLHGAKPPVWRRLELPGDLTLPQLHDVIQTAMGWYDAHLHRFRTGRDHRSPYFVTEFDLDEGDDGTLEDDVRLDQLLAEKGDELWYEYDFGDGWEHRLVLEAVLDEPPATVRCTAGRMACPPEDCGGLGGYWEVAEWVRSGYDDALLPQGFEDAAHGRDWLPMEWHPDAFHVDEINAALTLVMAEPVATSGELADLVEKFDRRGIRLLREVLARPVSHGPVDVTDEEAERITQTYRVFLDVVGDGITLTAAGYLPPAVVELIAQRSGIGEWWTGKANREDQTFPVADIRSTARALGLVSVRKGRLTPTAIVKKSGGDPRGLWTHIVGRLPLGSQDAERQAGWMALCVAGSGTTGQEWRNEIRDLLYAAGWRSGHDGVSPPPANSETLTVLRLLAGSARAPWGEIQGVDLAVTASARAAIQRR